MSVKIGEASPKGRMDLPPRGGGGGNMRGGAVGFPGAGFDSHFGPMGFGGTQGGFSGQLWVFNKKNLLDKKNHFKQKLIQLKIPVKPKKFRSNIKIQVK